MDILNTTSKQTDQAYTQKTSTAEAKQADVEAFESALNEPEAEPLSPEEAAELLIGGMVKMSLGGVQELFKKQMLGKPEDKA